MYVYGGVWLFVGQIPVLVCALVFGPVAGLFAALGSIAGLATGVLNSSPFISPTQAATWTLLLLEAVAVGELARRRHPVSALLLYWAVAGAPVMACFLFFVRAMPAAVVALVVSKNVIGGVFNVSVAAVLSGRAAFARRVGADGERRDSLVAQLDARISAVVAVPVVVSMIIVSTWSARSAEQTAFEHLQLETAREANALGEYLLAQQRSVTLLARVAMLEIGMGDVARNELLREARAGGSGFLTMLIADSVGKVGTIASSATSPRVPLSAVGLVGDRPYFIEPMRTAQPFLSEVFRGRGLGTDVVAAMSAPMIAADGRPIGVVEGSLDLARLSNVLSQPDDHYASVLDHGGHVVYSTDRDRRPVLSDAPAGIDLHTRSFGRYWNNDPKLITSRRETFYAVAPSALGWSVLVEVPRYAALKGAELNTTFVFLACILLFAGSLGAVRFVNRVIAEPLVDLELQATSLDWGAPIAEPESAGKAVRAPREIVVVREALTRAGRRISESFLRTQRALADRDAALGQRDETVRNLDRLVQERTHELENERDRAAAASRAKSAFLANMSHELRTPLNVVLGRAEAFADGVYGPLSPAQHDAFAEIDAQGRHLLALIGDILDLARIESGKLTVDMQPVDVLSLLRDVLSSFQDIATARGVTLAPDASPRTCVVSADGFRLRQILVNLVGNAVKFTDAGGRVGVSVEVRHDGTPVAIHVADSGTGIAPDRIPVIFGAFEQADASATRVHGGAGLGLAISRALSVAMGMKISVLSEVGRGSIFSLHFADGDREASPLSGTDTAVHTGFAS